MRPGRLFLTLACVGLLAGCATRPPAPVVLPALDTAALARAEALQDERARALAAVVDWDFTGRASITRGDKGGSGRIEWRQRGEAFEVALAAPVTRQGWRLAVDGDGARIDGLEGGPRVGVDGQQLLLEATGLEVPVGALGAWLRGLPADPAVHGPARMDYGADLMPARLEQGGWTIEFRRWGEAAGEAPARPMRIDAHRGDAAVRLVVDAWGGAGGR